MKLNPDCINHITDEQITALMSVPKEDLTAGLASRKELYKKWDSNDVVGKLVTKALLKISLCIMSGDVEGVEKQIRASFLLGIITGAMARDTFPPPVRVIDHPGFDWNAITHLEVIDDGVGFNIHLLYPNMEPFELMLSWENAEAATEAAQAMSKKNNIVLRPGVTKIKTPEAAKI